MFNEFLKNELDKLESQDLKRSLRQIKGSQGSTVIINDTEVLNFCSNNYLGLADDLRLADAANDCIRKQGIGAGASRLVCGNMSVHEELEKRIADFKGTKRCLVFATGYMANVGIISSLFNRDDMIFTDKLNHASIVDGIILSRANFKRYAHNDMESLEELLRANTGYKKKCIITDAIFSMDGDIAPLDKIVQLAQKYECLVMVDEAHSIGVMGKNGRGLVEHFGLEENIDIQMGTLSKAVGCFGAYVCGSKELIEFLINKARSFIYTTALPPAVAAAAMKSIDIISEEPQLRNHLWDSTNYLRAGLKLMGLDTMKSRTPICPVLIKDPKVTVEMSKRLLERNILVSAIRPPTVPQGAARLRLTTTAQHTEEDVNYVLDNIQEVAKDLCLI